MTQPEGALRPFFLSLCSPRLRDDALLARAIEDVESGHYADALIAVEYVCRSFPSNSIPAILRAKILQACRPELTAKAWHLAWSCDPENPLLQDAMLGAWLAAGAAASVRELGPAFLPERCRAGRHAPLIALLRRAGLRQVGACWKAGPAIEGMLFVLGAAPPDRPRLRLRVADQGAAFEYDVPADGSRFRLACPGPHGVWSLAVSRADSRADSCADAAAPPLLHGSPLVFANPAPLGAREESAPARPAVAIIIPVHRAMALARACIESVLASLPHNRAGADLLVIDDASPEPALSAWLDQLAASGRITLLRNAYNLGFIETVNRGMRHHPARDVLLLNADTLVHGDWIDRLCASLYSAADVASVSPWSNNGEISSFPRIAAALPAPSARQLAQLDATAARLHRGGQCADVELPSCCGFAMLIRRGALDQIGMLDGVALVRGYGEEVDWCLRARAAGWRHLAATGVFVAHAGAVSFRFEKTLRVRQNRAVLAARYPHYHPEYQRFIRDDPLAAARAALRAALEGARSAWLAAALGLIDGGDACRRALPAGLASPYTRIAVWRHRVGAPGAEKILALARLIAGEAAPTPPLRLLVIGQADEALWRTGVVDVIPSSIWQESTLLTDAALVGLAGCAVLLSAGGAALPIGIAHVAIDRDFEPGAWLAAWRAQARPAAATPTKKKQRA